MTERTPLEKERPPHYPWTFAKNVRARESLFRRVPVQPARFVVGMDEPDRPLFPPHKQIQGTAIQCASYVARVEEVGSRGEVTVTLWERPNGREGLTILSVDKHMRGNSPSAGDLLWIWTWVDVDAKESRRKKCIHIEVEQPELTDTDRHKLKALLCRLQGAKE